MRRASDKWDEVGYDPGETSGLPGCIWRWLLVTLGAALMWLIMGR